MKFEIGDILKRNERYKKETLRAPVLHADLFEVEAVYNADQGDYHVRCIYSDRAGRKGQRIVAVEKWLELVESP